MGGTHVTAAPIASASSGDYRYTIVPLPPRMRPILSVDVEEWFHVSALERYVNRADWTSRESRVVASTFRLLDLFDRYEAHGTFFVLGWVARTQPALVREIAARGHEIASHGFHHERVTTLDPARFRADVHDARCLLEDVVGEQVDGYRAPSFSIMRATEWALDILLETGHRYDSSRFPISRPDYGSPHVPRVPHLVHRVSGDLLELPLATASVFGASLPAAGGGYLRQFPLSVSRWLFGRADEQCAPAMLYLHPWELDDAQPRLDVPALVRWRHYRGLADFEHRLGVLLSQYRFASVRSQFTASITTPATTPQRAGQTA